MIFKCARCGSPHNLSSYKFQKPFVKSYVVCGPTYFGTKTYEFLVCEDCNKKFNDFNKHEFLFACLGCCTCIFWLFLISIPFILMNFISNCFSQANSNVTVCLYLTIIVIIIEILFFLPFVIPYLLHKRKEDNPLKYLKIKNDKRYIRPEGTKEWIPF